MQYFKLKEVTLPSEKYQKFKSYNGRQDIEYKLNYGVVEIKELIDYMFNLFSPMDVQIVADYTDHQISYYFGINSDEVLSDNILIGRSKWEKEHIPKFKSDITAKLHGSCHVATSDESSLNLIDEVVRLQKDVNFRICYGFRVDKDNENLNSTLTDLADKLCSFSKDKEGTSAPIHILIRGNKKVNIYSEMYFNYLSELYYQFHINSAICLFPELTIYAGNYDLIANIRSTIKKRTQYKNVYRFDYLFDEKSYDDIKNEIVKNKDKKQIDDYLFKSNFIITQFVPASFIASTIALPNTKIPGIAYLDEYDYGTIKDISDTVDEKSLSHSLGLLHKNYQTKLSVEVSFNDLIKHTLVTGVTGSGKTTSIKSLLYSAYDNKIPFLVLEPAKTEYKTLAVDGLRRYILGIESENSFRINPFEFPHSQHNDRGIHLQTHLDLLKSIFIAAFPMYGPMPYVLETAFYYIYQWYGWDFKSGQNIYWDKHKETNRLFPTLDDLYSAIDLIVKKQGYSKDLQNDLTAALKVRIGSLKSGAKGSVLNTNRSTPMSQLISLPTLIELERIGDSQEKVFIMGLLLVCLYEYYIAKGIEEKGILKHLLVIEEAHRLLENVQQSANSEIADMKGKAIETFNNILSEIRVYGEGIIIADQIPTKLSPDVIKNTNLKIVHRLFALDDRNAMGDAIGLDHKQKKGLIHLKTGEAIVYHADLQSPVKLMGNSSGLKETEPISIGSKQSIKNTDLIINTTAIISELKRVFNTAIMLDWNYSCMKSIFEEILLRFNYQLNEEEINELIAYLVDWFSISLRNNPNLSYNYEQELNIKSFAANPISAIERIRDHIYNSGHSLKFPESLISIEVKELSNFIYVFCNHREELATSIESLQAMNARNFRYYNNDTINQLFAIAKLDKTLLTEKLKTEEKIQIAQCLVFYSSFPHTRFEYFFQDEMIMLSDDEYESLFDQAGVDVQKTEDENNFAVIAEVLSDLLSEIKEYHQTVFNKVKETASSIKIPFIMTIINILIIVIVILIMVLR